MKLEFGDIIAILALIISIINLFPSSQKTKDSKLKKKIMLQEQKMTGIVHK